MRDADKIWARIPGNVTIE